MDSQASFDTKLAALRRYWNEIVVAELLKVAAW